MSPLLLGRGGLSLLFGPTGLADGLALKEQRYERDTASFVGIVPHSISPWTTPPGKARPFGSPAPQALVLVGLGRHFRTDRQYRGV